MEPQHVDVLIVGAGLSGIGAACHLRRSCPGKTFAILESRDAIGGTWDLFRYPGVRSDSDMFTMSYSFRPWTSVQSMADGDSIREYVSDTASEFGVDQHIRFGHRVERADWSSADARWRVEARRTHTGEPVQLTCSFLLACSGYYRYDEGYTPDFAGIADFGGRIVHPQHWPEDLDHAGKRVVVIGSGATAVTLVPAMAPTAAHVTMVQRSPSYVLSLPGRDALAARLRRRLPARATSSVVRWKNVLGMMASYQLCRRRPTYMKGVLAKGVRENLPSGYDVGDAFTPDYEPWDQRLCFVPDADLFRALASGRASIETGRIDRFTVDGIRLTNGRQLPADIVVTATGLNLLAAGGMRLAVDGDPVDLTRTVSYKGMMLSGVPNFALIVGYTNASWTLRADLVAGYVCRLLNHMDARGYVRCTPVGPSGSQALRPLLDLQSGYIKRGADQMPKQAGSSPWRMHQNYPRELLAMRLGRLGRQMQFAGPGPQRGPAARG